VNRAMDDAQLQAVWQNRRLTDSFTHVGHPVAMLMKHKLAKRVRQLSRLAEAWDDVIPPEIREHTALEGYRAGVLTVTVDSASHRFELQMLLAGGLTAELRSRFSGTLSKVRLVPGQFYSVDLAGQKRYGWQTTKRR
jgi:predicted nucleic acid-binding Zn ribbon protein